MECRICQSNDTVLIAHYMPYLDYETDVWDCNNCGSRFTKSDPGIYEKLHSSSGSTYEDHTELALKVKNWFKQGKFDTIADFMLKNKKNKYIINEIESCKNTGNILEIGCGKGYLTSYFISKGYEILGTDVSTYAINWAKEAFGDFFATSDEPIIKEKGPYDIIYHVGTIGCVEYPFDMTHHLLKLLRPGGLLLFNSPNIETCKKYDDIWIEGTQPPDLVTLFPSNIWEKYFSKMAHVNVIINNMTHNERADFYTVKSLKKLGLYNKKYLFTNNSSDQRLRPGKDATILSGYARKAMHIFFVFLSKVRLLPTLPAKFGVFVKMTKK